MRRKEVIHMMRPRARCARLELMARQWWDGGLITYYSMMRMVERVDRIRMAKGLFKDYE